MNPNRRLEKALAVASFIVAAALAFTSLFIAENHDPTASQLMAIAQFLTLTASILGFDYHFHNNNKYQTHEPEDKHQAQTTT